MAYSLTADRWAGAAGPQLPARAAAAVTPHDSNDLTPYAKSLYVGVAGDVTVIMASDKDPTGIPVLFKAHPVGYLNAQVRRVNATGTTATNITALYD